MEKLILLVGMVLLVSAMAKAQTDTTAIQHGTPPAHEEQSTITDMPDSLNAQEDLRKEDRVEIQKEELPAAVRSTLVNGEQFLGWEEANIYHDKTNGQYMLHMADSTGTRTYRFTEEGQPVTGNTSIPQD